MSTLVNIKDAPGGTATGAPRLLFLAHRMPFPPDKGDKIRSFREWKALSSSHRVTLAFFLDDPEDARHLPRLAQEVDEVVAIPLSGRRARLRSLLALPTRRSLSLAFYRSRAMERRLRGLAGRAGFDAVVAFSSTMAPYALAVPARRRVLDLCDLDSAKWLQYAEASRFPMSSIYRTEARRLGAYEAEAARAFDATLLVSAAEAAELRARAPGSEVLVAPNGVDLDRLDPDLFPETRGDGITTVFCGAMDYRSNVDAVRWYHDEILPLVRRQVPDARFRIVGSKPAPEVVRLGRGEGVEVTGRVEDVRPLLLSSAVSVAPLRLGRGVPNKILEALALALPVVTTSNGAAGLEMQAFEGADVADTPSEFADAVVRRLRAARAGASRFPGHRRALARLYPWSGLARILSEAVGTGSRVQPRRAVP